jgi:ubiquinol-cytochrome c reductase cytochrome c1 subunit
LQGEQVLHVEKTKDAHGAEVAHKTLQLAKPGQLTKDEYDVLVADLVAYLVFMGEPMADTRKQIGIWVLIALAVLFGLSYALKKNYWKDIH